MEGAREVVNTSGQRHVSGIVKIRLNVRRTSLAQKKKKKAMNTLLGQRKMTKKRAAQDHQNMLATGQCGQHKKKSSARGSGATWKHKANDAGRSFVGVQQTLLRGFRVGRRRVPPAFTSRKLEVEPLLVVPSLVLGLQPNGRKDDVDGPVAHDQP